MIPASAKGFPSKENLPVTFKPVSSVKSGKQTE